MVAGRAIPRRLGPRIQVGSRVAIGVANLSVTQYGSAISGLNSLFDQLQAGGVDPGSLRPDAVRDAVATAAAGAELSYDQESVL